MSNSDIKKAAKERGIPLWKIAEKMGIGDYALSRKMRHELPNEEKEQIIKIIDALAPQEVG